MTASALAGCTWLVPGDRVDETLIVPIDPALAAWAAADVCRVEFPGIDPIPWHAHAPLHRSDDDTYEVRIERTGPRETYRIATNGRMPPPTRIETIGHVLLRPSRFVCSPSSTDAAGTSSDSALIVVEPQAGGSRIVVTLRGAPARGGLAAHLTRLLEELAIVRTSQDLVVAGDWLTAERFGSAIERGAATSCCGIHQDIAGVYHSHRAVVHERRGRLPASRVSRASALSADPGNVGARAVMARLDDRIARPGDAQAALRAAMIDPSLGVVAQALRGRHARALQQPDDAATAELRARALLALGDLDGANAWCHRARALGGSPSTTAGDIERELGLHRVAFARTTLRTAQDDVDLETALRLAEDSIGFGDPAIGIRILARVDRGEPTADARLSDALRRLTDLVGDELSSRILATEHSRLLGGGMLARWHRADPTGASLLARLAALRSSHSSAGVVETIDHEAGAFQDAPGVAPMR